MGYNTVGFLQTELRQDTSQMKGKYNFPCHLFHHRVTHSLDWHPLKAQCLEVRLSEAVYYYWSNHEKHCSRSMTVHTYHDRPLTIRFRDSINPEAAVSVHCARNVTMTRDKSPR